KLLTECQCTVPLLGSQGPVTRSGGDTLVRPRPDGTVRQQHCPAAAGQHSPPPGADRYSAVSLRCAVRHSQSANATKAPMPSTLVNTVNPGSDSPSMLGSRAKTSALWAIANGTARMIPTRASPVISPEANSKPRCSAAAGSLWLRRARAATSETMPPTRIGVDNSNGRYSPTATANTGVWN